MQEALLNQYIASLKQRLSRLESLQEKLLEGNSKADENIRLLAHSLHGSGSTFGFPDISTAARDVEYADVGGMQAALAVLHKVLKKAAAAPVTGAAPAQPEDAARTQATATAPAARPAGQRRPRILVVEDDSSIAGVIQRTLESLPANPEVILVSTGVMAQEAVVKSSFDLIIMDLVLPDKDGRELIQLIKLEFRIKAPLLVLSALLNDAVRVECMSLGADKFLTKPFLEEELAKVTGKLLREDKGQKLTLVPKDGEKIANDEDLEGAVKVLAGKTILVADDDSMQAEVIRQRLIQEGAQVMVAKNGREAMQHLRSQAFSLVILDVKMPVMDGFEVLQRIKTELKLDLPVIMVTAMGSEADIIRGYDLGATDYILKPFSEVLLVARVKSLLKDDKV